MSEFTIAFELENMVPGKAGTTVPIATFISEDGVLDCYGTTKPADAAEGFATGCLFRKVNGGNATSIYVNEGDADSALFKAVTVEA
jgi:hypothetical protein